MSIALTTNSYAATTYAATPYANSSAPAVGATSFASGALASTTSTNTSANTNSRMAAIVEALTHALKAAGIDTVTSPDNTSPANSSAAIILKQLSALTKLSNPAKLSALVTELFSTNSMSSTNGAALMELNLNQLLNSSTLQKVLTQLPPELLSKPQVIEALVLQNTLLPTTPGKTQSALPILILPTPTNSAAQNSNSAAPVPSTLYRVNVEWQNKLIQLLSPQPLPSGTRVPLQIDPAHGANAHPTITLLRPEVAAKILLAQNIARSAAATNVSSAPQTAPTVSSVPLQPTPAQTIQQSLRELLPRQQALHTLVPLLQKFIAPAVREQLPPQINKALAQLLQSLPKAAQLQNSDNVKRAINNSGSFLEAKIANTITAQPDAEPLAKIAATDIKAQVTALLALVRQFAPHAATALKTGSSPGLSPQAATEFVADDEFVYTKPVIQHAAVDGASLNENESLDNLLSQLSKLLQSGFARIQLNQLDSANARHINHDSQAPVPTWVLELPLRTQHGVDQLQLRIEQHRKQQQQRKQVQWNVEIAFDLHQAGKIAASLAIVDNSVSATLWAEQEKTHLRVREEMDFLRVGLESVGVKVTEMQCRLGLPTPRANPISQQLVDVHT
ncbi:MAG: flagellar hook-length control protein FliK [Spongiibacteraceae bacterium]